MAADTAAKPSGPSTSKKPKGAGNAASKSKKKGPAAKARKKTGETISSKADLIRKVAGIIKAKGERPRPTEIVRILAEEGVTVAVAQVSTTLKAAGYRPLRKRRRGEQVAGRVAAKRAAAAGRSSHISMDDLLAAKSVSGAFGGTDKAIAALQALKRLED
ncbi:MAG: hypothetical protein ACKOTB_03270 [Planctomycetia bacterium]